MALQAPQVFAVGSPLEAARGLKSGTIPALCHLQRQVGAVAEQEDLFVHLPYDSLEGAPAQKDLALPSRPVAPRPPPARATKLRSPSVAQLRRKFGKRATEDKEPVAEHSIEATALAITPPVSIQPPCADHGRKPFVRRMRHMSSVRSASSQTSLVAENVVELEDGTVDSAPWENLTFAV